MDEDDLPDRGVGQQGSAPSIRRGLADNGARVPWALETKIRPRPGSRSGRTIPEPARRSTSARSSKDTNTAAAGAATFTADELKALNVESARKIVDLEKFVPGGNIDPVYFDSPYYVYPDGPIAVEALRVIGAAMAEAGVVGICGLPWPGWGGWSW